MAPSSLLKQPAASASPPSASAADRGAAGETEDPDKDQRRHKEFKSSLERLKSGLLKASEMVRQANFLASELQRPVKYSGITHTMDVSRIFIVFDE